MNRDRRLNPRRHERPLRVPRDIGPREHEVGDVAPWLIARVREFPRSLADRHVAARIGVSLQQVRRARQP